jgi:hypothetical protein
MADVGIIGTWRTKSDARRFKTHTVSSRRVIECLHLQLFGGATDFTDRKTVELGINDNTPGRKHRGELIGFS